MILDIEMYPQFVPWCLDSNIHEKKETEDFIEIKADLKVGKKFINETYSSLRSEERRVGKECRSRWSPYH